MMQVRTNRENATALAEVLLAADYRGHYSHGLNRLGSLHSLFISYKFLMNFLLDTEMYVHDMSSKVCDGNAVPKIIKDKFATALVDGCNTLGPVVGNYSMKLAIEKAKEFGVGWVTANSMLIAF